MAKEYRDIINPVTPSDWFLYYLFTDEEFTSIREQWRTEMNDIESGEPGSEGLPYLEQEDITARYTDLLHKKFGLDKQDAIKGLAYVEGGRTLNRDRIPTAKVEDDRITISIGGGTRLEDIEYLWNTYIVTLQEKLPGYHTQRSMKANEPLLAYIVYQNKLKGRKLSEIHKEYLDGTLDERLAPGERLDVNDFRKYYIKTVKGHITNP